MQRYAILFSVLLSGAASTAWATPTPTIWAYAGVTLTGTLYTQSQTSGKATTKTTTSSTTTTTVDTETNFPINNEVLIGILAKQSVISGTKYSLEAVTSYNSLGEASGPALYAVPTSGTSAAVLISGTLLSNPTSLVDTSTQISAQKLVKNVDTFTSSSVGTGLSVATVTLLHVNFPALTGYTLTFPCVSTESWTTLTTSVYPYPVTANTVTSTFFGAVDYFPLDGGYQAGVLRGTLTIKAPTIKSISTVAP